ncbi:hypothetical protein CFC21_082751 [Triticum aestivum]|uniref:Uncharacterized protein n=3 Tax=Triticum TaxID=4564 RepID=A0A9R1I6I6_WHEAT|nr:hypothetical protein CFC21_082747 [Triticum aestivum]KAF7078287.1 hypothetical protein CFC21_082750 [Triticum aestivum]KAF7078288.1 hypothetical protein CFC21_082751 [Triticum aestivum]VAI44124.1 unnamed protein product [Triticum turgidum subsp. durum]
MPSTPPWTNVAEGLLMEYEKEVAEKVWRGRRSGVVSPGCGGGVYPRRSRSRRTGGKHRKYWLLSRKGKFANVKKLFIGRKVVTCLLFVS